MSRALLHISSSQGDRQGLLAQAVERISFGNKLKQISNVYEAMGDGTIVGSPKLLSVCVVIETDMTPQQLLQFTSETENQLGKDGKMDPGQPYPIDIDLLFFDSTVIRKPGLTIPHPQAHERPFVMVPAAEIAGDWQHPVLLSSLQELASEAQSAKPGWGQFFLRGEKLLP